MKPRYSIYQNRELYWDGNKIFEIDKPCLFKQSFIPCGDIVYFNTLKRFYKLKEGLVSILYENVGTGFQSRHGEFRVYYSLHQDVETSREVTTFFAIIQSKLVQIGTSAGHYSLGYGYHSTQTDFEITFSGENRKKNAAFSDEPFNKITCVYNSTGFYVLDKHYTEVRIFYNHRGERQLFYYDPYSESCNVLINGITIHLINIKVRSYGCIRYLLDYDDVFILYDNKKIYQYKNNINRDFENLWTPFQDLPLPSNNYLYYSNDGTKRAFIVKKLFEHSSLDNTLRNAFDDDSSENHAVLANSPDYQEEYQLLSRCFFRNNSFSVYNVHLYELLGAFMYVQKNNYVIPGINGWLPATKDYTSVVKALMNQLGLSEAELFWFLKAKYFDVAEQNAKECFNICGDIDLRNYEVWFNSILDNSDYYSEYPNEWKNEFRLYKEIKKHCPDAIFQYKTRWLSRQSLDVYIPSKSAAIEYQGSQHYRPVEFFGGDDGFLAVQERDERKRKLCRENKVLLLEWHHNIPVNTITVEKYLKDNRMI